MTLGYRAQRYVQRNALLVLVASALTMALIVALGTTITQYRESVQHLARAEGVSEFLSKVIAAPSTRWHSELRTGPTASIKQVLTAASADLQSNKVLAPDIRIRLHFALSEAFIAWDIVEQAILESRRAVEVAEMELAPDDPVRAEALTQLAIILDLYETEEALLEASGYLDRAVSWLRSYTPDNYRQLVLSVGEIGYNRSRLGQHQEAIEHYREAFDYWRAINGPELHPLAALGYGVWGESYVALGQIEEAEAVFEKSIAAYEHQPGVAISAWPIPYIQMLLIHQYRADRAQVLALADKALRIADRAVQEEPRTPLVRAIVGLLLLQNNELEHAQQVIQQVQQDPNAQTKNEGYNAIIALANAELLLAQDKPEQALAILNPLRTLDGWPYQYFAVNYEVALAEAKASPASPDVLDRITGLQTRTLSDNAALAKRITALADQ